MKRFLTIIVALTGLAGLGCFPGEENELPNEFQHAIPSAEIVKLVVPGSEDEATHQALEAAKADGDVKAGFYLETINGVRELNIMTWGILHLVDDISGHPYTRELENGYEWGPFTPALSLVTIKFTLTKDTDDSFSYALRMRQKEEEDGTFQDVLTGTFLPEDGALHSKGTMALDFAMLHSLDPSTKTTGTLTFDYDTTNMRREILISFAAFQDEHMAEPMDAIYSFREETDLSGEYSFSLTADVHRDDPRYEELTLKEDLSYHIRWQADGKGRADVQVTEGDLPHLTPPFVSYQVSECWDEFFNQVFRQETVNPVIGDPFQSEPLGDAAQCVFTEPDFRE